jgi:hypothetical protein
MDLHKHGVLPPFWSSWSLNREIFTNFFNKGRTLKGLEATLTRSGGIAFFNEDLKEDQITL